MPRKVNPVPKGFRTVTPVLTVAGAAQAIDFYAHVFGAEERSRVYGLDGVSIAHSELKIGNSLVIVSDENPAFGIHAPSAFGGSAVSQHIYVADVDGVWERAIEAGATVLVPLADTYWGERYAKIVDPFGHVWSMAKRVEHLSADEIAARAAALTAPVEIAPVEVVDAVDADAAGDVVVETVPDAAETAVAA